MCLLIPLHHDGGKKRVHHHISLYCESSPPPLSAPPPSSTQPPPSTSPPPSTLPPPSDPPPLSTPPHNPPTYQHLCRARTMQPGVHQPHNPTCTNPPTHQHLFSTLLVFLRSKASLSTSERSRPNARASLLPLALIARRRRGLAKSLRRRVVRGDGRTSR